MNYDQHNSTLASTVLLTRNQAADFLGLSVNTLDVWRSTGRYSLPYVRVGRLIRYRVSDLLAFLDRRTQTHTD